jgi:hypothetical protein
MAEYGFGCSYREDEFVYGAQRPGFPGKFVQRQVVENWLDFIKKQGISRIICLLSEDELSYYRLIAGGLLGIYADNFGADNVLWAPTSDRHLCSSSALKQICYFMRSGMLSGAKTVVHCSSGQGRTGLVLAAWLIYNYSISERKALRLVEELNRSPREAVFYGNATEAELLNVLSVARELDKPV